METFTLNAKYYVYQSYQILKDLQYIHLIISDKTKRAGRAAVVMGLFNEMFVSMFSVFLLSLLKGFLSPCSACPITSASQVE